MADEEKKETAKKTADICFQIICCHYIIYIYCFVV